MADSFGLDSSGNVVMQQPVPIQKGPQTQIPGGGATFSGFGQQVRSPGGDFSAMGAQSIQALDALNKLTQGIIKPIVEREQRREYFEGMSEVAQGKALIEIQKEQPWYTQIFGPSATVQGAQQMTMMSALNQGQTEFMKELPDLRSQPPDVVRKYLVDQAVRIGSTGDPSTDAMIQAKLAEQWGPMMGTHMKHHIAYVQEKNVTSFENMTVTAGDNYQSTVGQNAAFVSPEQAAADKARALDTFKPIPGMTTEAWVKATTSGLRANLMKGNFGIFEAFKGAEEWNQLPLNTREYLQQTATYAVQYNAIQSPMFREDMNSATGFTMALSQGTGPQSVEQVHAWLDQQNKAWADKTGSATPYYDNKDYDRFTKQFYQGQEFLHAQQAKAAAASAKVDGEVADTLRQQTELMRSVNSGAINPVAMEKLDQSIVQTTLSAAREKVQNDPVGLRTWLAKLAVASEWGDKTLDKDLKNTLTIDANNFFAQGTPITDAMRTSLEYMRGLISSPNGVSGLANYIGGGNAAKILMLMKSGIDLSDKSAVDSFRESINQGMGASLGAVGVQELTKFIENEDPGWARRILTLASPGDLTGVNLNDDSKRRMVIDLAPQAARYMAIGLSQDDSFRLSFNQKFGASSNVDFIDGAYVPPSLSSSGGGLFSIVSKKLGGMSQLSEDYQTAVSNVINNNMATAVGKVKIDIDKDLTRTDRAGNAVARTMNNLIEAVPFGGRDMPKPFDQTGRMFTHPDRFYPEDYKTVGGLALGGGVIQVMRVPKSNSSGLRTYTVTITADQVIDEIHNVRKANAERQSVLFSTIPIAISPILGNE